MLLVGEVQAHFVDDLGQYRNRDLGRRDGPDGIRIHEWRVPWLRRALTPLPRHAAAVFGCGYLVALLKTAVSLWETMGFSPEQAIQALMPLSSATLGNVARGGLLPSATGPAIRGDLSTLRSHLEALFQRSPELVSLYGNLARASLPLAVGHGLGPSQLTAIEELVDHYIGIE
mgnify:CR=1 FL=1